MTIIQIKRDAIIQRWISQKRYKIHEYYRLLMTNDMWPIEVCHHDLDRSSRSFQRLWKVSLFVSQTYSINKSITAVRRHMWAIISTVVLDQKDDALLAIAKFLTWTMHLYTYSVAYITYVCGYFHLVWVYVFCRCHLFCRKGHSLGLRHVCHVTSSAADSLPWQLESVIVCCCYQLTPSPGT